MIIASWTSSQVLGSNPARFQVSSSAVLFSMQMLDEYYIEVTGIDAEHYWFPFAGSATIDDVKATKQISGMPL